MDQDDARCTYPQEGLPTARCPGCGRRHRPPRKRKETPAQPDEEVPPAAAVAIVAALAVLVAYITFVLTRSGLDVVICGIVLAPSAIAAAVMLPVALYVDDSMARGRRVELNIAGTACLLMVAAANALVLSMMMS